MAFGAPVIRRAVAADVPALAAIGAQTFAETFGQMPARARGGVVLLQEGGEIGRRVEVTEGRRECAGAQLG